MVQQPQNTDQNSEGTGNQTNPADHSSEHDLTLSRPDPVMDKLKSLGISGFDPANYELPAEEDQAPEPDQEPESGLTEVTDDSGADKVEPTVPAKAARAVQQDVQFKSSFTRWLSQLPEAHPHQAADDEHTATQLPAEQEHVARQETADKAVTQKKQSKKKQKKKKKKEAPAAEQVIILDEGIASETLAELLASQGYVAEAIAMYERLRLKYPEKSRFFAAKIDNLQEKH